MEWNGMEWNGMEWNGMEWKKKSFEWITNWKSYKNKMGGLVW